MTLCDGYDDYAVGKRLALARKTKRMTQVEAADILDMSISSYTKIETGKYGLRAKYVPRVCELFDCSVEWLMTGKGEPPNRKGVLYEHKPSEPMILREVKSNGDYHLTLNSAAEFIGRQLGIPAAKVMEKIMELIAEAAQISADKGGNGDS